MRSWLQHQYHFSQVVFAKEDSKTRYQGGRYAEAEPLHKRSLAIWEKALGPDHPDVAKSLGALAFLSWVQGRAAEAMSNIRRATAIHRRRAALTARPCR